ncbi:MAG: hypothetical protein J1D77_00890 [Muribaculaceae bacterium]|nr:hypothetical protein [Muribaculaceae bacterium]
MEYVEIPEGGNEFIVILTIEGTPYEEVEVQITDPYKTIRDQIENIVRAFELPKVNDDGEPIIYHLGKLKDSDDSETFILDETGNNGEEKSLMDYNIERGDHLHLLAVPIAG